MRSKINILFGPQEPLLATVKRRKLASPKPSGEGGGDTLEDGRRRGRQRTASKTGHHCPCRNYPQEPRAKKAGGGSLVPRRPNRSRDWSELIGPLVQRRHTGLRSFLLRGGLRLKRMRASVLIRFPWHEFYYWFIFIFFAWQTKLLLCEGRRTIGSLTQNKLCDYVAVKVRYLVGVLSPVSHEGLHQGCQWQQAYRLENVCDTNALSLLSLFSHLAYM